MNVSIDPSLFFNRCMFTDGVHISDDFMKIARMQPSLTFDRRFLSPKFSVFDSAPKDPPVGRNGERPPTESTPFHEIWLVSSEQLKAGSKLNMITPINYGYTEYLKQLHQAFRAIMLKMDPSRKYLHLHSSGVDSRIISGIMAELRREGLRDFNNVHFRCWGDAEVGSFKRLMNLMGWKNWSIYSDLDQDAHDVGRTDVCVDGWYPYTAQLNVWRDLNPREYTLIIGAEGFVFRFPFDRWQRRKGYCGDRGEILTRYSKIFNGIFLPMLSYEVLSLAIPMLPEWRDIQDWRLGKAARFRDTVRVDLVEMLGLVDVPIIHAKDRWNFSVKRQKSMLQSYYDSKFFKEYRVPITNLFNDPVHSFESHLWAFATTVYEQLM